MKPINERERTTAFIQFIALLTVVLILAMAYVLVNPKVKWKDDKELRNRAKSVEGNSKYYSSLYHSIDTIEYRIKNLDNIKTNDLHPEEYILENLQKELDSNSSDPNYIPTIKSKIKDITVYWVNDKKKLREIDELKLSISNLEKEKSNLSKYLISKCNVDKDALELIKGSN